MTESSINTSVATAPPVPASVPKVSYPPSLPISRKAYRRFIDRIHQVYSAELPVARLMVSVLDVYLLGDRHLAGAMLEGSDHKHAFSFLCQDVDMAIERSRRARQQALARRLARQQTLFCQQAPAIPTTTSPTSIPLTSATPTASTSIISTIPSTSAPSVPSASSATPAPSPACSLSIQPAVESPAPLSLPTPEPSADIVVSPSVPALPIPEPSADIVDSASIPALPTPMPSTTSDNCDPHSALTKAESAILSGQEIGGHEIWSGRRVNDMSRIPMFSSLLNPVVNTIARTRAERRAQEQSLKRKLKSRNRPLT